MSISKFFALLVITSLAISACGAENAAKETKQVDKLDTSSVPSKATVTNIPTTISTIDVELQEVVLPKFLVGADLKAGKREFAKCRACHTLEQGQRNKMGPNLFGMFGNKVGFNEEFRYSKAIQDSDLVWSMENLDHWLENPREFLSGTSMAFVGIRNEQKRRALMAYLYIKTNEVNLENADAEGAQQ
ncbi:cytochrome c family protein [Oceanicaulis sp. AH-315-P02]|nr:cytochrome c family protein [Robiginitomaculum sp.]MBN4047764.1 cytochrome c family protein [Oceanicaulis sp. AH-315-P02]